jgi:aryl-phospho-beta-D-glucosidase BglC (GH1 family)
MQLHRGINLSGWFAGVYEPEHYTKEHFQKWITIQDLVLIKSAGFDHVRLGVDPQPMFKIKQPDEIPADYLVNLDAAVRMILDNGLGVVISLHPESDFKAKVTMDDSLVQQLADFWRALAGHYSTWDPEHVFFEILNEPELVDSYRWHGIQAKLAAAVRKGAPRQTIVAVGARWSSDDGLVFLEPLRDPNVIHSFHFYEPFLFTHQGATWGAYPWHWVNGLRYPSVPEQAAHTASAVPNPVDRLAIIRYGYEGWNAARINAEIAEVATWAREHGLHVICDEFGVYRERANPEDRATWIKDVRTSLERHGIGWAMWDYSGNFGLVVKKNGEITVDAPIARALGLKLPAGRE